MIRGQGRSHSHIQLQGGLGGRGAAITNFFPFFFFKFLLNVLLYCFCFMFWFSCHWAYGILASPPGTEPTPSAMEGRVLTTGSPGKSLHYQLLQWGSASLLLQQGEVFPKSRKGIQIMCPQTLVNISFNEVPGLLPFSG